MRLIFLPIFIRESFPIIFEHELVIHKDKENFLVIMLL
jgi:hypothetical protein